MITFESVTVTAAASSAPFGDGRAGAVLLLGPVSCTLTERRVAVIGANGSGKSTLARLVNGLVLPSSGRVLVDGLDTARRGPQVRRRVGFVFTDPDAQLVMPTAQEDILLSLRRSDLSRADRETRAKEVLEQVGLGRHATVPVHALSGGQKQLLALAGVLATGPAVLVCDEPTTLLDLRWRRHVDALIEGLDQQVVLVTHDLDSAARADRVLVVDHARVVHDGAAEAGVAFYRDLMASAPPSAPPGAGGRSSTTASAALVAPPASWRSQDCS